MQFQVDSKRYLPQPLNWKVLNLILMSATNQSNELNAQKKLKYI